MPAAASTKKPPAPAPDGATLRNPGRLDELLNYRLSRLHAVSGAPVVRLLEGRHGITRREWRLLAALAEGGASSPSALADQLQLDRPRTSRAIGILAAKGLLQRRALRGDARRATVALTETGHALYAQILPEVARINASVVAALDDTTLAALDRALTLLSARARALNEALAQDVKADRRAGGSRRLRPLDDEGE